MPENDYTPQEALDLLLNKVSARDIILAEQVRMAIDAGKDINETEPAVDKRKKARIYRKTVPFTPEEALQIALDVLQAYFVEQPLFVDSAADNLAKSAIGIPKNNLSNWAYDSATLANKPEPLSLEKQGVEKAVEIEMQTETQLSKSGDETLPLERVEKSLIDQQVHHIDDLRKLAIFSKE